MTIPTIFVHHEVVPYFKPSDVLQHKYYKAAVRWSILVRWCGRRNVMLPSDIDQCWLIILHPRGININHPYPMTWSSRCGACVMRICRARGIFVRRRGRTREQRRNPKRLASRQHRLRRRESDTQTARPGRHINLLCLFRRARSGLWESRSDQVCGNLAGIRDGIIR